MNPRVLSLAERVISKSDRAHPADALLRQELKTQQGLTNSETTEVARAVFSYFRWRGWVEQNLGLREQVSMALDLAQRFMKQPESFSDAELISRALPSWVQNEIQLTPEFARALQTEPLLWLRARPGQGIALAKRLGHCRVLGNGSLSDSLVYQGRDDLFHTPEFHTGGFEVQDLSSQAVSLVCAPGPGQTWWDVCAGEGGKLLHLSDLMKNKGLIWATDRAEWRLRRLKRRAARAKVFNYRTATWTGASKLPTKTKFDGVLLDAPCSGIGTWQRNPHARWTLTAEDLNELAQLQLRLLMHAAPAVKPGGRLVYSVCSVAESETVGVLKAFEKCSSEFEPLKLKSPLAPNAPASENLFLRPEQMGGNGMFIAAWLRAGKPAMASP